MKTLTKALLAASAVAIAASATVPSQGASHHG